MLIELNQENFGEVVFGKESGTVLVDFYASWCAPCKMLNYTLEEIAEENPNITIGKVNIESNSALASEYDVMALPTLIVFHDGEFHKASSGYAQKESILKMLV